MPLKGLKVGVAFTGSFCTFSKVFPELEKIAAQGAEIIPIISEVVDKTDTRFGTAEDLKSKIEKLTPHNIIKTIAEAEPIGPKAMLDILVVAPCTGNTLSKLANGITDTSVTMACKAHLRNGRPLVLAIATNDGLGANAKNIGMLLNTKGVYFVPFSQDDPVKKTKSVVADFTLLIPTLEHALEGKQIQPVLC